MSAVRARQRPPPQRKDCAPRAADTVAFTIPARVTQLTYAFDDGSMQAVGVMPGAAYTIPTNLNRSAIADMDAAC